MMRRILTSLKPLLFLGMGCAAMVGLFRDSITRAIDTHPLLQQHPAAASLTVHFAPEEDLEQLDRQQLLQARSAIDISMYSFTDRLLAETLRELAQRGVRIRIYRDQEQFHNEQLQLFSRNRNHGVSTADLLRGLATVHIRIKRSSPRDLMHQKDYSIDGKWLREGSANWSPSAEKDQDNSLSISTDPHQIANYEHKFDQMWNRPSNLAVQ
jgi:phosphatidylserine/phosphatidylglycerophosphate/cardiolipin synthase-like enzyme